MIIAAADGSALGNPGPAGWAWYIDDDCWHAGGWPDSTNNRGELMAVLDLLNSTADQPDDLKIYCDSQYVINALTKWMPGWKRKGWKKADGKEVLNKDLLASLDEALSGRTVDFTWVKGHNNHEMNEAADVRARAAATAYQNGTTVPVGPGFTRTARSSSDATDASHTSNAADRSAPDDAPDTDQPIPQSVEDTTKPLRASAAAANEPTTVVSCRVPASVADELVARAHARGIHPQEFLAEIIGRSLENE